MAAPKHFLVLACAVLLALGACTKTKHVRTGGGGDPAELEAAQAQAATEKARADALAAALVSLERAQAALVSGDTAQQRTAARAAVVAAQKDLTEVQEMLQDQPGSDARTAADAALMAVGTALERTAEALQATDGAMASGAGQVQLANMHTTLDRAQAAVDAAQAELKTALAAEGLTPELRNLLTQARGTLTTAQVSLVPLLRQELAAARTRADEYDPRLVIGDRLTPLKEERIALPLSMTAPGEVTWTPRTTSTAAALSATPNPDALDIPDEAVPYADGRRLFPDSGGGQVSADEFQLRGIVLRGDQLGAQPDRSSDGTSNPAVMGSGAGVATWSNFDATYESSIRMRAAGDGMVLRMGGAGTIFYDMEWLTALGPGATLNQPGGGTCANVDDAKCDDPTTSDVEATFGTPVADPDGDAAWHFSLPVPVNPATPHTETRDYAALPNWAKFTNDTGETLFRVSDANGPYRDSAGRYRVGKAEYGSGDVGAGWQPLEPRRALRIDRGRPADQQGVYNAWLSNYAGGAGTDDDPHRYLQYAAYGLFNFLDYSTTEARYSRLQALHFGYDAFRDAPGRRPVDWGTASNPITATFEGRTTGWLLQSPHDDAISRVIRLRGDVTLTANLNAGGDGHGTVQGAMRDLEFLNNGVWGTDANYRFLRNAPAADYPVPGDPRPGNAVILEAADIAADGSFSGVAYAAANSAHDPDGPSGPMGPGGDRHNFADGSYGGAFYGPAELGELEATGYWRLPLAAGIEPRPGTGTLIGSFGVRSERPAN